MSTKSGKNTSRKAQEYTQYLTMLVGCLPKRRMMPAGSNSNKDITKLIAANRPTIVAANKAGCNTTPPGKPYKKPISAETARKSNA